MKQDLITAAVAMRTEATAWFATVHPNKITLNTYDPR